MMSILLFMALPWFSSQAWGLADLWQRWSPPDQRKACCTCRWWPYCQSHCNCGECKTQNSNLIGLELTLKQWAWATPYKGACKSILTNLEPLFSFYLIVLMYFCIFENFYVRLRLRGWRNSGCGWINLEQHLGEMSAFQTLQTKQSLEEKFPKPLSGIQMATT